MKIIYYILVLIITLIWIFEHYLIIKIRKSGTIQAWKILSGLLYLSVILLLSGITGYHESKSIWKGLFLLPFTFSASWFIKDALLGILLAKNLFYLGSGTWDSIWKKVPEWAFLALKLMLCFMTFPLNRYL